MPVSFYRESFTTHFFSSIPIPFSANKNDHEKSNCSFLIVVFAFVIDAFDTASMEALPLSGGYAGPVAIMAAFMTHAFYRNDPVNFAGTQETACSPNSGSKEILPDVRGILQ